MGSLCNEWAISPFTQNQNTGTRTEFVISRIVILLFSGVASGVVAKVYG